MNWPQRLLLALLAALVFGAAAIGVALRMRGDGEPSDAEWCVAYEDFWTSVLAVEGAESVDDRPVEDWERVERAADAFRSTKAPAAIDDDVAVAYSPERSVSGPLSVEDPQDPTPFIEADTVVFRWTLDNCDLTARVRAAMRDEYEQNVEWLGWPDTGGATDTT